MAADPFVLDTTGRDIHGEGALLRARGAMTRVELPGGVVAWSINRIDVLKRLLGDARVSKDPRRHWPVWRQGGIPEDWPLHLWVSVRNMFTAYGDEHRRLRSLVSKAFTPRRIEALRPTVEAITAGLLDDLDAGPPRVDLRAAFAYPLPIEVVCRLIGVPDDIRPGLRRAVDLIFDTAITPAEALANRQDIYRMVSELVALRRRQPADDVTSGLIAACDEQASRLSEEELVDTVILLISAGHETTVNLLDHAITALLAHPDQLRLVLAGERSWSDAVHEVLRWQAPVANLPLRYAVDDIAVNGVLIRRGEAIIASYGAAGRDPDFHGPTADRFDITREDKTHLAFGHGAHFCLGAPLVHLEAEVALPALFARFPDLALAVPADRLRPVRSFISNGHDTLPVVLRAG
ncbi:cytochrome P450 family protein [Saccharothrix australiensis]|uniref:Cytochrome P450 n=1 Tax=Saccharothrix australiensis TaxID=2072 RepID=A0A495W4R3_9PSEU|nr:cytochrome P450 [Saccharothrix australiensis]RKT54788.1 cytochrome P450 [Saccharothrix australiensis]